MFDIPVSIVRLFFFVLISLFFYYLTDVLLHDTRSIFSRLNPSFNRFNPVVLRYTQSDSSMTSDIIYGTYVEIRLTFNCELPRYLAPVIKHNRLKNVID